MRSRQSLLTASLLLSLSGVAMAQNQSLEQATADHRAQTPNLEETSAENAAAAAAAAALIRHGVPEEEARQRVASLSDEEKLELSETIDEAPAGGDSTITIGVGSAVIIALLLIIFL